MILHRNCRWNKKSDLHGTQKRKKNFLSLDFRLLFLMQWMKKLQSALKPWVNKPPQVNKALQLCRHTSDPSLHQEECLFVCMCVMSCCVSGFWVSSHGLQHEPCQCSLCDVMCSSPVKQGGGNSYQQEPRLLPTHHFYITPLLYMIDYQATCKRFV